jgi:hypothetical protein
VCKLFSVCRRLEDLSSLPCDVVRVGQRLRPRKVLLASFPFCLSWPRNREKRV